MSTGMTTAPVRALMTRLIDYAGLFPPAQLPMEEAIHNYAGYLRGPHAWMLGRFVLPVSRIDEFDAASATHLPSGERATPWRVAALAGGDLRSDMQEVLKFNCRHWQGSEVGHAIIDTIEIKSEHAVDSDAVRAMVADFFTLYVEGPRATDAARDVLQSVQRAGARAKLRTGAVTADGFPDADTVLLFLETCAELGLAFKATAGLHHVIRSEYRLTYETDSASCDMYGFLNMFLAAAALVSRAPRDLVRAMLLERSIDEFRFEDTCIAWRDVRLSTDDIARGREFATSFGSCSFREPVDELHAAGLLQ